MARNFCLLIFGLVQTLFCSDIFWFSYKIVTVNSVAVYEEKNITPIMIPFGEKKELLCTVALKKDLLSTKEDFLRANFDKILPCFYHLSTRILSNSEHRLKQINDRIELVIEPVRFTVEFKDEFATINAVR